MIKTRDDNKCIFLGYLKRNQLKFTNGVNLHSLSTDYPSFVVNYDFSYFSRGPPEFSQFKI